MPWSKGCFQSKAGKLTLSAGCWADLKFYIFCVCVGCVKHYLIPWHKDGARQRAKRWTLELECNGTATINKYIKPVNIFYIRYKQDLIKSYVIRLRRAQGGAHETPAPPQLGEGRRTRSWSLMFFCVQEYLVHVLSEFFLVLSCPDRLSPSYNGCSSSIAVCQFIKKWTMLLEWRHKKTFCRCKNRSFFLLLLHGFVLSCFVFVLFHFCCCRCCYKTIAPGTSSSFHRKWIEWSMPRGGGDGGALTSLRGKDGDEAASKNMVQPY